MMDAQELAKDRHEAQHQIIIHEIRANYEVTKSTREEAGVQVPTYEQWLERELELHMALVAFYREQHTS